jgi:hypothetical protein
MITAEEQCYLYWLASQLWSGAGHIVEMGPWLGGSTVCLAAGMSANTRRGDKRLHVFDNFIWRDFMTDRAPIGLSDGESFEPQFRRNVEAYADLIVTHRKSLPDDPVERDLQASAIRQARAEASELVRWDPGEPIEILFIDGAKSWNGLVHLLAEMGAGLRPDSSLIACQDYKYWGSYWVPLVFELLIDQLELTHVLTHNTVTFRLRRPLSDALEALPDLHQLDPDIGTTALDTAARRLRASGDATGAAIVELTKVRFLGHVGRLEDASRSFRHAERRWPISASGTNLELTRRWLEQYTGRPAEPTWGYRVRRATAERGLRRIGRLKMLLRRVRAKALRST